MWGDDPLADFSPNLAAQLRRISGYDNVGDLLINSFYNPQTREVAAFEELIGCHGGAGGPQQAPFLLYPAAWTAAGEDGAPSWSGRTGCTPSSPATPLRRRWRFRRRRWRPA